jgi:hypothetical protein
MPARSEDLGLDGIDISSAGGGAAALEGIDEALQSISSHRDNLGEADAKVVILNRSLGQARDSLLATQDLARTVGSVIESASLVSYQLKQQGRNAILLQGNLLRSTVQSLLGQ